MCARASSVRARAAAWRAVTAKGKASPAAAIAIRRPTVVDALARQGAGARVWRAVRAFAGARIACGVMRGSVGPASCGDGSTRAMRVERRSARSRRAGLASIRRFARHGVSRASHDGTGRHRLHLRRAALSGCEHRHDRAAPMFPKTRMPGFAPVPDRARCADQREMSTR
ncbi:hypothetical protein A8H35_20295 [Burkholderia thailandensis]|nr:hypothetical protein WJ27_26225 [Burkholderia thailandensis]AVR07957.1 hypothetical protein A8H31_11250 [Burkholderia thailandensis]AWY60697.1 hypothetical protein A8H35_20295 [Burkholderia thailandensis]KVG17111.1 hypothetical protein WJ28_10525 [Burkholderia thailandensis]KVG17336.1 hypothetical protein WJ25_20715 [Burkholderia thailandensis]